MQSSPLSLRSLFSTIFFFCLSLVSLCRLVFGGVSVSWTPPLTDNSLDGTLLCTVQCTAILPQWALGLWWMVRITHTPLGGEWYLPDGGRGGGMCDGLLMRVDRTMSAPGKLGPTGISLVSNLWHGAGCWLCGVCVLFFCCFVFVVLQDGIQLVMWTQEAWVVTCVCAFCDDAHPLLCCYGDCCSLSVVVYIIVQTVTWGLVCKSGSHFIHSTHKHTHTHTQSLLNRGIIQEGWIDCRRILNECMCVFSQIRDPVEENSSVSITDTTALSRS